MRNSPRRVFEPPKRTRRVRDLMKRMKVDPAFNDLVSDIVDLAKEHGAKPHTLRGAADVVVQRMREKAYGRSIREEPKQCGGSGEESQPL